MASFKSGYGRVKPGLTLYMLDIQNDAKNQNKMSETLVIGYTFESTPIIQI